MPDFNTNTANHDEWLTPPWLLHRLGRFDLDPCAPVSRPWPTAAHHYTLRDNGLNQPWHGRIWLNPPYGRQTFRWMDKLATHTGGGIALIFARTETKGFHHSIWRGAQYIFFFHGRLRFWRVDGTQAAAANAPSCLVAYRREERPFLAALQQEGKGILVERGNQETDTPFVQQPAFEWTDRLTSPSRNPPRHPPSLQNNIHKQP